MVRHLGNIQLDQLGERRGIRQAGLLLEIGEMTVAFATDLDRFSLLPQPPAGTVIRSLSADGTAVVLVSSEAESGGESICLLRLDDSRQQWLPAAGGLADEHAMLAPDGKQIAVLSSDEENAVVSLLDIHTAQRRRVWQAAGSASWESGLCWSPSGSLLAVTYMIWDDERDDDALSTVVIDPAGALVKAGPFIRTFILGATRASWLNDQELCFQDEYDELVRLLRVEVSSGNAMTGPRLTGRVWSVVGERHIQEVAEYEAPAATTTVFYSTNPQGTNRTPLFTIEPKVAVGRLHLAPQTLPTR
jgi:hypothetical protein